MARTRLLALITVLLIMTGCTRGGATPAPVTVPQAEPVSPPPAPTQAPASPKSDVEQAEAMLGRGETKAAIALLTRAAETTSTADIWNLLSYGYLLEQQWQAAAEAGYKALMLDQDHPYARYNTGMAELALKQYQQAIFNLLAASRAQPDRVEPLLGLARAYQESGKYALAANAVVAARKLAPEGIGDVGKTVESMVRRTAPADLTTAAKVRLNDAAYTIYLYPGTDPRGPSPVIVYLAGPHGVTGLPVGGFFPPDWTAFTKVDLPDGAVGYFVPGEDVGAYVSGSRAYRLFVRSQDGTFSQVLFVGGTDPMVPIEADFIRSGGIPHVQGDKFVARYRDEASGKTTIEVTWQLVPGEPRATEVKRVQLSQDPNK